MHSDVATELVHLGIAKLEHDNHTTCSAFHKVCKRTIGKIFININLINEQTNEEINFNALFKVLENLNYDIIIGRPDIKKHNLTQVCASQFTLDDTRHNNDAIVQVKHTTTTNNKHKHKQQNKEGKTTNDVQELASIGTDHPIFRNQHSTELHCRASERVYHCNVLESELSPRVDRKRR
jgi:hypothetical protein